MGDRLSIPAEPEGLEPLAQPARVGEVDHVAVDHRNGAARMCADATGCSVLVEFYFAST